MSDRPNGPPNDAEDDDFFGGAETLPGNAVCPACGEIAEPMAASCRGCGYYLSRAPSGDWPATGAELTTRGSVLRLSAPLPHLGDFRRFLSVDADERRYEVLVTRKSGSDEVSRRTEARAVLGDRALPPAWASDEGALRYTVTELPQLPTVADGLGRLIADRDHPGADPVSAVRRWVWPVVAMLGEIHDAGRFCALLSPSELFIREDGACLFRDPATTHDLADAPVEPGLRRAVPGFSAPEVLGRCGGGLDARTDVFFGGIVLYYALARIPPLEEAGRADTRLPSPHIYTSGLPPELVAVARRATSPLPERRYSNAGELASALQWALEMARARDEAPQRRLQLDIGHELHVGVLKGQYAPKNQDDLFLAYDGKMQVGLFVVSDGVSIAEYGSGDLASACVREQALDAWSVDVQAGLHQTHLPGTAPDEEPTVPLDTTEDTSDWAPVAGPGTDECALQYSTETRRALLRRMLDAANGRIAERIHEDYPVFHPPPEGIMGATALGLLLDGNRGTFCAIGDSRIYLVRDGHISPLNIDHDLATQLLRMGRTPTAVEQVPAGAALIRCVGEFDKDANNRLIPVPLQPEFRDMRLLPGDTIVLCSDGIPDYAGHDEEDAESRIRAAVEAAPDAPWAAFELMVAANRGGGGDNISCVVLMFGPPIESEPTLPAGGSHA